MFIKTESGTLINSDYIRAIFIDDSGKRPTLNAELDNAVQYVLATWDDPHAVAPSMDELLEQLNEENAK